MREDFGWELLERLKGNPEMGEAFQRSGQKILEGGRSGALELMMLAGKLNTVLRNDDDDDDDDDDVVTEAEIIYKILEAAPDEKQSEMLWHLDNRTLVLLVHYMGIRLRFLMKEYNVEDF
jgi:hypothetical protein